MEIARVVAVIGSFTARAPKPWVAGAEACASPPVGHWECTIAGAIGAAVSRTIYLAGQWRAFTFARKAFAVNTSAVARAAPLASHYWPQRFARLSCPAEVLLLPAHTSVGGTAAMGAARGRTLVGSRDVVARLRRKHGWAGPGGTGLGVVCVVRVCVVSEDSG